MDDHRTNPKRTSGAIPCRRPTFCEASNHYAPGAAQFVPFSEITFIVATDEPDQLQQIHIAEQKFSGVLETLRVRNEMLEEFYRDPSVQRQNFDFETGRSVISAEAHKIFMIRQVTNNLYEQVDKALPKLGAEIESLEKFVKKHFPGRNALKMVDLAAEPESVWKRRLRRWFGRNRIQRLALLSAATICLLFLVQNASSVLLSVRGGELVIGLVIAGVLLIFNVFGRWITE